jgi:DNA topoisomerase-1
MSASRSSHATPTSLDARRRREAAVLLRDSAAAARAGSLEYVSCERPCIRRLRRGKGFQYFLPNGRRVTNEAELRRFASLAIPPAWRDVRICTKPNGHLQCTGYDARGRKQYRYHPRWRKVRDEAKYHDILLFAASLPALRRTVERDLASPSLSKSKVLAAVLRIMERTSIRVGNERYAEENGSFGLTTLLDRHVRFGKGVVEFRFKGKGGKVLRAAVRDQRLANVVRRCRDIPGQRLFQYIDANGRRRAITSTDVNAYIQAATGHAFTAKEFRTWAATVHAATVLHRHPPHRTATERRAALLRGIDEVASHLGNTRAICKKCYIHPAVMDAYLEERLAPLFSGCLTRARPRTGLDRAECAVLAFFEELSRAPLRAAA